MKVLPTQQWVPLHAPYLFVVAGLVGVLSWPAQSQQPICLADCDDDWHVRANDLVHTVARTSTCPSADFNGDGTITSEEIDLAIAQLFGACPLLTPQGYLWAQKIIDHSLKMARGEVVNEAPFVNPGVAPAIALVASVVEKIAANSDDFAAVVQDADYLAMLDLVRERVAAENIVTPDSLQNLYQLLNMRPTTYPPPSVASPRALRQIRALTGSRSQTHDKSEDIATAMVLADTFHPKRLSKERGTEGQLFLLGPTNPEQVADMYFVNGVQQLVMEALYATAILGWRVERNIDHIHNEAGLLIGDAGQALTELFKISNDRAVARVEAQILAHAAVRKPAIFICYSQGAAICAQGVTDALAEAATPQLQNTIKKITGIITLGGFTENSKFPSDMLASGNVNLIERADDPIPKTARALDWWGNPLKPILAVLDALRSLAEQGFKDHALINRYASPSGSLRELLEALAILEVLLRGTPTPPPHTPTPPPRPTPNLSGTWEITGCPDGSDCGTLVFPRVTQAGDQLFASVDLVDEEPSPLPCGDVTCTPAPCDVLRISLSGTLSGDSVEFTLGYDQSGAAHCSCDVFLRDYGAGTFHGSISVPRTIHGSYSATYETSCTTNCGNENVRELCDSFNWSDQESGLFDVQIR